MATIEGHDQGASPFDATRRTRLANERTQLAWWRTGLTAFAVALGVGRVVPEIAKSSVQWPYVALGAAFAVYGVVLIAYGSLRASEVERAVSEGAWANASPWMSTALGVAGAALGIATGVLIVTS